MAYAFFKRLMGAEAVDRILNAMEYTPHVNEHWDPFSVVHKVRVVVLRRQFLRGSNSSCRFQERMRVSNWESASAQRGSSFGALDREPTGHPVCGREQMPVAWHGGGWDPVS
jgi:hypothetical protein